MCLQGLRSRAHTPTCYATEREHFKILKHAAANAWCWLIAFLRFNFYYFYFFYHNFKS